jgi:DNA-directed RNA polymerase specialized sigma24 family protein
MKLGQKQMWYELYSADEEDCWLVTIATAKRLDRIRRLKKEKRHQYRNLLISKNIIERVA